LGKQIRMVGEPATLQQPRGLRASWPTFAIYLLLTVTVLVPVFSVRVPCLGDYINHLARIHILTTVAYSPALQQYYVPHWRLVPYLGMDLPVALLAPLVGLYQAGRLFVAVCVMMPALAAAALRYAIYRRIGLIPAFGFLLSYGWLLEVGFLNYLFSAGLAVMLFAAWLATQGRHRSYRVILFAAAALVIYIAHAFAFVAYGLLLAGREFGRAMRQDRPLADRLLDLVAAAAQALPTLLFVLLLQADLTTGDLHSTYYDSLGEQLATLMMPLYFVGHAWVIATFLLLPLAALLLARWIRLAPALWPALALLGVVACLVPDMLFGVYRADVRLPLVFGIVFIGATRAAAGTRAGLAGGVLAVMVALVMARSADAFVVLRRLDAQVAEMRQLLQHLPLGQRLLVVDENAPAPARVAPPPMTGHLGLLATVDRDAFVPYLFIGPTAVQLRPQMQYSASAGAQAITAAQLDEGLRQTAQHGAPPPFRAGWKYWLDWPAKFDYVLVIHFGADMGQLPPVLRKVASVNFADLYQITTR
jgi:hypothetical protein